MNNKLASLFSNNVNNSLKENLNEFIKNLNENELKIFNDITNELYEYKIVYDKKSAKITNNSIKLCLKLYRELNIKTFPKIETCTRKGYSMNDGTFAFTMRLLEDGFKHIHSYSQVKDCIKKSNEIKDYYMDYGTTRVVDII
ncbi:hypothetical protein ACRTAL_002385 [Clostridium perfringens]